MNSLEQLNEVLFDTLYKVQKKEMDVKTANAVVSLANAITNNQKVCIQLMKYSDGNSGRSKGVKADIYEEKLKFANSLGFNNVADAVGKIGLLEFNEKFKNK